jgi:hypothetical protein
MLVCVVGVVVILVCALMAIITTICGDWTVRLAWLALIGFGLVGFILEPIVPYGNILGVLMAVLGVSVAFWILVSDYR